MKYIVAELLKLAKQLIAQRQHIDKTTEFFKSLIKDKVSNNKQIYKDDDGRFYQFDELHGHWQKYDRNGKHVSVLNQNGKTIGKAIKGRKIDIK